MARFFANVGAWRTSRPGRLVPAGRGIWALSPDRSGPSASKLAGGRVAHKLQGARVAHKLAGSRVVRWRSDMARHPAETVMLTIREDKTVCFDFTNEGAVQGGEAITNPLVTFAESVGTPTMGPPAPNATDFYNSDGKKVKAGKGVLVKMAGVTAGKYNARCVCEMDPSGDVVECPMLVMVTD